MAICFNCKKKISFWNICYDNEDNISCESCLKNNKEKLEKQKIKEEEDRKREIEKEKNTIKEYKRKCNQCGKIWHSLVDREKQIAKGSFLNALVGVGTALTGNLGASTQSNRNVDAQNERLDKLKSCPSCGSTDYTEKIIILKNK